MISPLLANIYLDPLDWLMAGLGFEMVRYADDMVVFCRTQEEAESALEKLREWMTEAGLNTSTPANWMNSTDECGFACGPS